MEKYITIKDIQEFLLKKGIMWEARRQVSKTDFEDIKIEEFNKVGFGCDVFIIFKDEGKKRNVLLDISDTNFNIRHPLAIGDLYFYENPLYDFSKDWIKYLLSKHSEYAGFLEVKANQMKLEIKKNAEEQAKPLLEKLKEIHKKEHEELKYCDSLINLAVKYTLIDIIEK